MDYELLEDPDAIKKDVRRREARNAITAAVMAELEYERVGELANGKGVSGPRQREARLNTPALKNNAKHHRRRADAIVKKVALEDDEVAGMEQEMISQALLYNEQEHAQREAEIELMEEETSTIDDPDMRVQHEERIVIKREELDLVGRAHDILVQRRGK